MKIMVLGANGMLGNAVLRYFAERTDHHTIGTVRSASAVASLPRSVQDKVVVGGSAEDGDALIQTFQNVRPDLIINCLGIVKQRTEAKDPLYAIPVNAVLPHRLLRLCGLTGARLVHLSTDCVFKGSKGMYREEDVPDADDVYGRTKLLGEVDAPHAVTLRTSIIGHELATAHSLIGWFLRQEDTVKGHTRAIFSGLPTVEIARIIDQHVIGNPSLHGVYHLSAEPIDKASLLRLVASEYGKQITIEDDPSVEIDRSLDSSRFRSATGFSPKSWDELVRRMHQFHSGRMS